MNNNADSNHSFHQKYLGRFFRAKKKYYYNMLYEAIDSLIFKFIIIVELELAPMITTNELI